MSITGNRCSFSNLYQVSKHNLHYEGNSQGGTYYVIIC